MEVDVQIEGAPEPLQEGDRAALRPLTPLPARIRRLTGSAGFFAAPLQDQSVLFPQNVFPQLRHPYRRCFPELLL